MADEDESGSIAQLSACSALACDRWSAAVYTVTVRLNVRNSDAFGSEKNLMYFLWYYLGLERLRYPGNAHTHVVMVLKRSNLDRGGIWYLAFGIGSEVTGKWEMSRARQKICDVAWRSSRHQ